MIRPNSLTDPGSAHRHAPADAIRLVDALRAETGKGDPSLFLQLSRHVEQAAVDIFRVLLFGDGSADPARRRVLAAEDEEDLVARGEADRRKGSLGHPFPSNLHIISGNRGQVALYTMVAEARRAASATSSR